MKLFKIIASVDTKCFYDIKYKNIKKKYLSNSGLPRASAVSFLAHNQGPGKQRPSKIESFDEMRISCLLLIAGLHQKIMVLNLTEAKNADQKILLPGQLKILEFKSLTNWGNQLDESKKKVNYAELLKILNSWKGTLELT